jgi:glucosamine-6-phosphate deaminase
VAFNEPGAADPDDPEPARVVPLADASRRQQVHDRRFADLASVPSLAITVTMSAILRSRALVVTVPGRVRAAAVARALDGPVDASSPASALRRHPDAELFLDADAAASIAAG